MNVALIPGAQQQGSVQPQQPNIIPIRTPEETKFYKELVNTDSLFANKLCGLFFGGRLIPSGTIDPESPIPGYRLVRRSDVKENISIEGFTTLMHMCLIPLGEDKSTTLYGDDFQLPRFSVRQTMSIIVMLAANHEDWKCENYTLIWPFGHALWDSIVAIHERSVMKKGRVEVLLDKIFHPSMWQQPSAETQQQRMKNKWLNF